MQEEEGSEGGAEQGRKKQGAHKLRRELHKLRRELHIPCSFGAMAPRRLAAQIGLVRAIFRSWMKG